MIHRLSGQLPTWARPSHPVLRYELGKMQRPSRRVRLLRAFGVVMLGIILVAGGYLAATGLLARPAGQSLTEIANAVVFWPLLVLQVLLRIASLTLTSNAVS